MLYPDQPAVPSPVQLSKAFERKRQRRNNYFAMFSCKAGRVMSFYSEPEYDHWALNEINPDVIAVCEEPLKIQLPPTKKHPDKGYVIDLWLRYSDGLEEYVEVKPENRLTEDSQGRLAPANWEAVEQWMAKHKRRCRFITDSDIYTNTVHVQNARRITCLAAQAYELRGARGLSGKIMDAVTRQPQINVSQVEFDLTDEDPSQVRAMIGLLIIMGRLSSPLTTKVFDRESTLELCDE